MAAGPPTAVEGGPGQDSELSRYAGYMCISCKQVFHSLAGLRQHRWHFTTRGTPCEDLESSAARKNIPTQHLATGLERLEPLFRTGARPPCVLNSINSFNRLQCVLSMAKRALMVLLIPV